MKPKLPKLVLIEWLDSCSIEHWHDDKPDTEPLACRSVGWLVHDGKRAKTIAAHMSDDDPPQRSGEMTIPVVCITKITRIRTK